MPNPTRLAMLAAICGMTLATWSDVAAQERTGRAAARVRVANPFAVSRFTRYRPNWLGLPTEQEAYPFSFGAALGPVEEPATDTATEADSQAVSADPVSLPVTSSGSESLLLGTPENSGLSVEATTFSPQASTVRPPFRPRVRSPFRPPPRPPF